MRGELRASSRRRRRRPGGRGESWGPRLGGGCRRIEGGRALTGKPDVAPRRALGVQGGCRSAAAAADSRRATGCRGGAARAGRDAAAGAGGVESYAAGPDRGGSPRWHDTLRGIVESSRPLMCWCGVAPTVNPRAQTVLVMRAALVNGQRTQYVDSTSQNPGAVGPWGVRNLIPCVAITAGKVNRTPSYRDTIFAQSG